ncbi:hypothetical protein EVJ32_04935 [Exiguobacterium sp. SH5S4]|uniref:hypothetical protein n=1 Tax=Exiguobacterium sp. SH5S4 TaxID=2510961 RepID=UPI00103B6516|nr:hypothetical protein [Exiguobacterium sp. SH5S4]TCI26722.1 hypothetical protein EVJ32_04935 [Exiguobacterium sp. SH5S4]
MGVAIFLVALSLFLFLSFDFIFCDFELTGSLIGKTFWSFKGIFIEYSTYEVSKAEYMPSIYGGYYRVVVEEDGVKIPIDCPDSVARKLCDIMALNSKGSRISVKAKIDHKRLKMVSLKGYMVKQ